VRKQLLGKALTEGVKGAAGKGFSASREDGIKDSGSQATLWLSPAHLGKGGLAAKADSSADHEQRKEGRELRNDGGEV